MIKDTFNRDGRWNSVGLGCHTCQFFDSPEKWPDYEKTIYCKLHKLSLSIEIGKNFYMEGEWICKKFTDNGKSLESAVRHFETVKDLFEENTLYSFSKKDSFFEEHQFKNLKKSDEKE